MEGVGHFRLGVVGEQIELIRDAGAQCDAIVEEVREEAEEGLEGFPVAVGMVEDLFWKGPLITEGELSSGRASFDRR